MQLVAARASVLAAYQDIRNASPTYRLAIGKDFVPLSLATVREWVTAHKALMLYFVVGETESHLIAIGGDDPPRISTITADETQARDLGISPGRVHAAQLRAAIVGAQGLLGKLSDPQAPDLTTPLASLFKMLIPDAERKTSLPIVSSS